MGKSTNCRNLGSILAREGYKLLAVDCDNLSLLRDKWCERTVIKIINYLLLDMESRRCRYIYFKEICVL